MKRSGWALLALGGAVVTAAVLGGSITARGSERWYRRLRKPSWNPPDAAFGPVWTGLYSLMTWSAWRIWRAPDSPDRRRALGLWALQLALNAAWTPLFFGLHRPRAALADLGLLLAAIGSYTSVARRIDGKAALAMAPYLAWTGFAGALNAEIVRLNPNA